MVFIVEIRKTLKRGGQLSPAANYHSSRPSAVKLAFIAGDSQKKLSGKLRLLQPAARRAIQSHLWSYSPATPIPCCVFASNPSPPQAGLQYRLLPPEPHGHKQPEGITQSPAARTACLRLHLHNPVRTASSKFMSSCFYHVPAP